MPKPLLSAWCYKSIHQHGEEQLCQAQCEGMAPSSAPSPASQTHPEVKS